MMIHSYRAWNSNWSWSFLKKQVHCYRLSMASPLEMYSKLGLANWIYLANGKNRLENYQWPTAISVTPNIPTLIDSKWVQLVRLERYSTGIHIWMKIMAYCIQENFCAGKVSQFFTQPQMFPGKSWPCRSAR